MPWHTLATTTSDRGFHFVDQMTCTGDVVKTKISLEPRLPTYSAAFLWIYPPYIQQIPTLLVVLSQQKPSERGAKKGAQKGAHCNWLAAWQATTGDLWSFPLCCEPELKRQIAADHGRRAEPMDVGLYGLCVCKGMCICKYMSVHVYIYICLLCVNMFMFMICSLIVIWLCTRTCFRICISLVLWYLDVMCEEVFECSCLCIYIYTCW